MKNVNRKLLRSIFLLMTLSFFWNSVYAERVSLKTARQVALTTAKQLVPNTKSALSLDLTYAAKSDAPSTKGAEEIDFFVFNIADDQGFVIVSGEDRTHPILGYSREGSFKKENMPINISGWLEGYQKEISYAVQNDLQQTPEIQTEWLSYLNGDFKLGTEEVLLETAKWDQNEPYNRLCPLKGEERTLTGCVATAMAEVMRYNKWPDKATSGVASYKGKSVKYKAYDWDNLPLKYIFPYDEDQANAVAALMWNIGANVNMDYGTYKDGGSAASSIDAAKAFSKVFKYAKKTRWQQKRFYSDKHWAAILQSELNANRPLYYDGSTKDKSGHAFVCDGYMGDKFHFNWGWGGQNNGYFLLSSLDPTGSGKPFSEGQGCIVVNKPGLGDDYVREISLCKNLVSPKPKAGSPFSVSVSFANTGNDSISGSYAIAVVDVSEYKIKKIVSKEQPYGLAPNYGYWDNSIPISVFLSEPLEENDRLMLVNKFKNSFNWEPVRTSGYKDRIGVNGPEFDDDSSSVPEVEVCTVTMNLENITAEYSKVVNKGDIVSGTLVAEEGYSLPESIEVKVADKVLSPFRYFYNKKTGEFSIINVQGDVEIKAVGVKQTVANEDLSDKEVSYSVADGKVQISTANKVKVSIYTFTGVRLYDDMVSGNVAIPLSPGAYVLDIDGKRYKVIL